MRSAKGYILMLTLSVITVLSLLVLSSMQELLMYQKVAAERDKQHQLFYQMEHLLLNIAKQSNLLSQACMKTQDDANGVLVQLMLHRGCIESHENQTFRYFIEDLGLYPCIRVLTQGKSYATRHARISLMGFSQGMPTMQVRVFYPSKAASCDGLATQVEPGVGSWRFLWAEDNGYINKTLEKRKI